MKSFFAEATRMPFTAGSASAFCAAGEGRQFVEDDASPALRMFCERPDQSNSTVAMPSRESWIPC
jgi:hypothetical protein